MKTSFSIRSRNFKLDDERAGQETKEMSETEEEFSQCSTRFSMSEVCTKLFLIVSQFLNLERVFHLRSDFLSPSSVGTFFMHWQ